MKHFALRGLAATTTLLLVVGISILGAGIAMAAPPTPAPSITAKPAAFVNTTDATFSFTHADPTAVFTCALDAAKAKPCTSPITYTGLAVKSHTFAVRAQVTGRKVSKPVKASWTIDQTAPLAPTVSQPASPTKNTTASITFAKALSDTDVTSFLCSLDGAAATACTSPKSLPGLADGVHSFAVTAVDHAANTSSPTTVVWTVDTAVSDPFITSAPPSTSTASVDFDFASVDTDVTFECSMDSTANASYTACTSPKNYPSLSNSGHTFRVRAVDTAGNVSNPASYAWTVAVAPPIVLAWTDPTGLPGGVTSDNSGTFAFSATPAPTTLTCKLDTIVQASCSTASPGSVNGLADGSHTYDVIADAGLGTQNTLSYAWVVDTVDPGAPTITGPTGRVGSADAAVVVTPADPGDALSCELDSVSTPCEDLASLTGLADGDHTVDATASDAAGNTASDSLTWTVDTTGPVATPHKPTAVNTPYTVTFDEAVSGVDARSVVLATTAGKDMKAVQSCLNGSGSATNCSSTNVKTVKLTSPKPLLLGESYRVQVNPLGSELVTDDLGNVAGTVDATLRMPTTASESGAGGVYTWHKVSNKKAKGGSYYVEHRKTAKASWTFKGKAVTWLTEAGPSFGKADVYVDGHRKGTVNNYAKSAKYGVGRTFKGFSKGTHTIEIRVLGKTGAKVGKGTSVSIDGFKVGKKVTASPALSNVAWQRAKSGAAQGGAYAVADLKGQTVKVPFRGTAVTLQLPKGSTNGKASVYLDGKLKKTLDLYSKHAAWGNKFTLKGLTNAKHTVMVKVLGKKNHKASNAAVMLDGISVK